MRKILIITLFLYILPFAQQSEFRMARLKYGGGSDWYNDPSAEINLLRFIEKNTGLKVRAEYNFVDISTEDIFSYPFLFMTGHGNVVLSDSEAKRLRRYLENGGFLYVDDDYGLDKAFRREIAKVFPDNGLQEVPFNHPVYNIFYNFSQGPPKTHKHDENPPGGYGIFYNGRMVLYYTVESNPSDGWADPEVHDNPPEKREEALKFGTNIVLYAISN